VSGRPVSRLPPHKRNIGDVDCELIDHTVDRRSQNLSKQAVLGFNHLLCQCLSFGQFVEHGMALLRLCLKSLFGDCRQRPFRLYERMAKHD
jgi:hypothetical protein